MNVHTESEAQKLWCPHVRTCSGETNAAVNRLPMSDDANRCVASRCAMWQWEHGPYNQTVKDFRTSGLTQESIPGKGFCGLARK